MITKTAQETIELGKDIAKSLKPNDVIALIGELGSGKTTFTKGIAEGLGVPNARYVNSPSFVLVREHKGTLKLFHLDLYRLNSISEIQELGFEEYFYSGGVTVIEWAQKLEGSLLKEHLSIEISMLDNDKREIKIEGFGKRYKNIANKYND